MELLPDAHPADETLEYLIWRNQGRSRESIRQERIARGQQAIRAAAQGVAIPILEPRELLAQEQQTLIGRMEAVVGMIAESRDQFNTNVSNLSQNMAATDVLESAKAQKVILEQKLPVLQESVKELRDVLSDSEVEYQRQKQLKQALSRELISFKEKVTEAKGKGYWFKGLLTEGGARLNRRIGGMEEAKEFESVFKPPQPTDRQK